MALEAVLFKDLPLAAEFISIGGSRFVKMSARAARQLVDYDEEVPWTAFWPHERVMVDPFVVLVSEMKP
jgi:hypothetical protein